MRHVRSLWSCLVGALAALAILGAPEMLQAQQGGTVQGTITNVETGQPLAAVQVSVVGTQRGSITNRDGEFTISNVPAGAREVRAQSLGYGSQTQSIEVVDGQTVTVNFELRRSVLDLAEIIVTGVAGDTERAKLPFTVARLTAEQLPVPSPSAATMLQGKVAGASVVSGSGRPGATPSILLRGATSIQASGRSQEPLYIVDGVILGAAMVDIDALDIESIEVVKGAAAASLYGSRAANGVVQITTRRGRGVGDDQVRYTVRTEYGGSSLPGRFNLTQAHQFATEDGLFVGSGTERCEFQNCSQVNLAGQRALAGQSANAWNTIQVEEWPGQTFDHVERFFQGGNELQNYVSVEGRSGGTNYLISFSNLDQSGILPGTQRGFQRNNFRMNVDQAVRADISLSGSAFYSRSEQSVFPEGQGNPIFQLTRMPAGVDLSALDDDGSGQVILRPDPFNDNMNPLNVLNNREYSQDRGRFLGSATARWTPVEWFALDANFSYDRLDQDWQDFYPKGYRTLAPNASLNEGQLFRQSSLTEAMNSSITGQFRWTRGDLSNTTQVRYLFEREDFEQTNVTGEQFAVDGVPTISNTSTDRLSAASSLQSIRSDGVFLITNFDYRDRYILDALVRNDGYSVFGPDERRHFYYRGALAYRISEEEWFNLPNVNELKLFYSYGTAGNTPSFAAQYETYSVAAGSVSPQTLGNRSLKPEFAIEQEMGVEAILADRFSVDLVYARSEVRDQILSVPTLAFTGFSSQFQNAGTLESNTIEFGLNASVMQRQDFSWSSRLLFDRTRSEITQLNRTPFSVGVAGQNLGSVFYVREGERIGTFYGVQVAENCGHLPAEVDCSQFDVNDDGFLVWVGDAGSWRNGWDTFINEDGQERYYWGSTAPFTIRGGAVTWGAPIVGEGVDRVTGETTTFLPLGSTVPDYTVSLSNTFNYRGFTVYGLIDAVQGFKVYNQPLQWATFQNYSGIMDQRGKPENEQKPVGYYDALYGVSGLQPSSAFVDDASFIKLRELSVRYRAGQDVLERFPVLGGLEAMTVSLTGRNLWTRTDYDGYDPEVGRAGGSVGSAALARVDGFNYPNFRTWTFGIELNF